MSESELVERLREFLDDYQANRYPDPGPVEAAIALLSEIREPQEAREAAPSPRAEAHDDRCEAEQPVLPVTGYTACGCAERAAQPLTAPVAERGAHKPAQPPSDPVVEITYELGQKFWHTNCPKNSCRSGIMRELRELREPERSVVECLHCGQRGYYPVGAVGVRCSPLLPAPPVSGERTER